MSQIYIHYGSTKFDLNVFTRIRNSGRFSTKPIGGLWASRIDSKFGWKNWCLVEDFRDCKEENSFKFECRDESNIRQITTKQELESIPGKWRNNGGYFENYYVDFEKCLKDGIDALELCYYGDEWYEKRDCDLYFALYGWDCDCILVLNPEIIIPVL